MSLVVAIDGLKPNPVKRGGRLDVAGPPQTTFFRGSSDTPDFPSAWITRYSPGRVSSAHFHTVDQFQIIVNGKGKFGRHDVSPYCVHFSRAYTPYGPLLADKETGWAFMVLRTRYDPGAQRFPAAQEKLKQIPDRRPWQITKRITFPAPGPGISLQDIAGIKDDQGLFAYALTMAPRTRTAAPDPSSGDGQFVVVLSGSLVHDNREHKATTVAFVKPEEDSFEIYAGPQGLEGLVLNLPQVKPRAAANKIPSAVAGLKRWQCVLCSFAYDEAQGMPEEGISPGTRWEDVPATWTCPDCSASKMNFQMIEA